MISSATPIGKRLRLQYDQVKFFVLYHGSDIVKEYNKLVIYLWVFLNKNFVQDLAVPPSQNIPFGHCQKLPFLFDQ